VLIVRNILRLSSEIGVTVNADQSLFIVEYCDGFAQGIAGQQLAGQWTA
jgi:hypothetical protein